METQPKTLEEAVAQLDVIFNKSPESSEILSKDEQHFIGMAHHGIGRWMRNNWGLGSSKKSELHKYFESMGLQHPDDMSGLILRAFYRKKINVPMDVDAEVQKFIDYWKK